MARRTVPRPPVAAEDLVAAMAMPCWRALRSAADVGTLLREDLERFELPEGYSPDEVWRILTAVRKQAAVMIPDDPAREADLWMVTTSALSFQSEIVEVRSKAESSLSRSLAEMQGSPFVTRFIERTLQDGLRAEGIALGEGRIHELFAGAVPEGPQERLVVNYFRLSNACDELARRRVTQGLIETLYYELMDGVDPAALPRRQLIPIDARLAPPESQRLMDLVCQRAQDAEPDIRFGPVLRLVNIGWFFWYFDVIPHLNSLVGLLLRNIIAIQWGLPVLSWLPAIFDPRDEGLPPEEARRQQAVFEHWSTDIGFGFDFTPYFELNVGRYLEELEGLAAAVAYLERLNQQIERLFESHINHRQKSILSALCREPDALLRIAPHQRSFRVAYGTARADFLDLEEQGYLVRQQQGRAFVFRAHPALRDKIVQLGQAATEAAQGPAAPWSLR